MPNSNGKDKKVTNEKLLSLAGVDFKKLLLAFLKVKEEEDESKS